MGHSCNSLDCAPFNLKLTHSLALQLLKQVDLSDCYPAKNSDSITAAVV